MFHPPFDVQLGSHIVQPDLIIVCDLEKLTSTKCIGAPDLIAEVVSASSNKRDTVYKHDLYQEYKVKEFWQVYPSDAEIWVYTLEYGKYGDAAVYKEDDLITLSFDPSVTILVKDVFD